MNVFIGIYGVVFLVYSVFVWKLYWTWKKRSINHSQFEPVGVTIIIPCRNEAKCLPQLLHAVKCQDYPKTLIDVVVVDDFSTDDTSLMATNFKGLSIQLIQLEACIEAKARDDIKSYKKLAIELAIQRAKHKLIVTVDADCTMQSAWLQEMVRVQQQERADMVIGRVEVNYNSGFVNAFQTLDLAAVMGVMSGMALRHKAISCNGANLLYSKEGFYKVSGFEGVNSIPSGDDQLLMLKFKERFGAEKLAICSSRQGVVYTRAVRSVRELWHQRIRWASKMKYIQSATVRKVGLLLTVCNLLYVVVVILLTGQAEYAALSAVLILRAIVECPLIYSQLKGSENRKALWWYPLVTVLYAFAFLSVGLFCTFVDYQWKGRAYKNE